MPIYEYVCKKCGALREEIHGISETPRIVCAECGGKAERKISSGAVIFKGSGFYVTDYGKKSQLQEKGPVSPKGKKVTPPAPLSTRPLPRLSTDPD